MNLSEKQRKRPVGRQPLTSHPLFPAIVALWFGALFGLGSLAIRPALIEQMVVAGGIDTVIPMAAPPLGVTTRILLALAMTGLGGLIGALIARQLSRPKQEKRERRRAPRPAAEQATVSAPEAKPAAGSSTRRRALAMTEDNSPAEPCDAAPVPGHSARILDVTEFELEGFEQLGSDEPASETFETAHDEVRTEREPAFLVNENELELELDGAEIAYVEEPAVPTASPIPADAQVFAPGTPASYSEPAPTEAEPIEEVPEDAHEMAPADQQKIAPLADDARQVFDAPSQFDSEATFPAAPTQPSRSSLNNRLFEAYSRDIAARADRAGEAEAKPLFNRADAGPAETEARPQLLPRLGLGEWDETYLDDSDEDSNVAGPEQHEPLFPRSLSMKSEAQAPVEDAVAVEKPAEDETVTGIAAVSNLPEPEAEDACSIEPAFQTPAGGEPCAVEPTEPVHAGDDEPDGPSAAERIASSELDELSPVELLERLAMSMARRRVRTEATPAPQVEPDSVQTDEKPFPNPWSNILPLSAELDEDDDAGGTAVDAEVAGAQPAEEVQESGAEAEELEAADEVAELPAAMRPVPAALRPVSFEADGDAEELPGYVPPRSIGMLNAAAPASSETQATRLETADDEEDEITLEEGYSSLLNLSRPFDQPEFVRIDEPEPEADDEIQPFVVFPGEESRNVREAAPALDIAMRNDRPFDPPAADSRVETEETERKLRAALANLQRISGAA